MISISINPDQPLVVAQKRTKMETRTQPHQSPDPTVMSDNWKNSSGIRGKTHVAQEARREHFRPSQSSSGPFMSCQNSASHFFTQLR